MSGKAVFFFFFFFHQERSRCIVVIVYSSLLTQAKTDPTRALLLGNKFSTMAVTALPKVTTAPENSIIIAFLVFGFEILLSLFINLQYVETIQRPMLGPNIMMKQNHGVKGVMLHLLVLHRMKLINLMPLIWLIQVVVY